MKKVHQTIIQNLQYIKSSNTKVNSNLFPDFLLIGPHRTGTTWLYKNLNEHPQILFPIQKEVHFFCEHEFLRPAVCQQTNNDLNSYLSLFRKWDRKYLSQAKIIWEKTRELYLPKIKGEATACYAVLDQEIIREIFLLNPNLKIILTIRNPVDRAWSHAIHYFVKQKQRELSEISDREWDDFFHSKYILNAGQYTKIIENWSSFTAESNFFVGFFDEIKKSPEELLLRVYTFLGIRSDSKYIRTSARSKVNVAVKSTAIPEKFRIMLTDMYKDELTKLKQTFNLS